MKLNHKGIHSWMSERDIELGEDFATALGRYAIRNAMTGVLLASPTLHEETPPAGFFSPDDVMRFDLMGSHAIVPGRVINGSTIVPARALLETMGYTVGWDNETRTVVVRKK